MTSSGLSYTTFTLPLPSSAAAAANATMPTIQAYKLALNQYAPDDVLVTFAAGAAFSTTLLSNCTLLGTGAVGCEQTLTSQMDSSACPALNAAAAGNALLAAGEPPVMHCHAGGR